MRDNTAGRISHHATEASKFSARKTRRDLARDLKIHLDNHYAVDPLSLGILYSRLSEYTCRGRLPSLGVTVHASVRIRLD